MKQRITALTGFCALVLVIGITGRAFAQSSGDTLPAKPLFGHMKPNLQAGAMATTTALTTFNGSFSYGGHSYPYTMVGTAPSTGIATTIPVYLIPINLVLTTATGTKSFSPTHVLWNGQTVIKNVTSSPVFTSAIDFNQGGTDLGTTQYIDAFQRGNFWGQVKNHPGYHLFLGSPTVEPVQTLNVPSNMGIVATEFGVRVGVVDITWFDTHVGAMLNSFGIPNTALTIFLTYDVYLWRGQCCIGGYHSAAGFASAPFTYLEFGYINHPGAFSEDILALTHEVGEWADDPYVGVNGKNQTPCGLLEVGDPEEGAANYGGYPYVVDGFTYNLQDMVWLPYFGAPPTRSANEWLSFQGNSSLSVCSNGP